MLISLAVAHCILKAKNLKDPDTILRNSSALFKNEKQTNLLRGMIILP